MKPSEVQEEAEKEKVFRKLKDLIGKEAELVDIAAEEDTEENDVELLESAFKKLIQKKRAEKERATPLKWPFHISTTHQIFL